MGKKVFSEESFEMWMEVAMIGTLLPLSRALFGGLEQQLRSQRLLVPAPSEGYMASRNSPPRLPMG
jgi:hypothetical protein